MPKLDYYFFQSCPFCQRVGLVIDELKIKVSYNDITQDQAALKKLVADTGRRTVPCLYIDESPMHESADIIAWLHDNKDSLEKVSYMEVRDPVHGSIHILDEEIPVLKSAFFQRLRNIKQLGFSEYSFPGATHTRYIHSIGVIHVASKAFDGIFIDHIGKKEFQNYVQLFVWQLSCMIFATHL